MSKQSENTKLTRLRKTASNRHKSKEHLVTHSWGTGPELSVEGREEMLHKHSLTWQCAPSEVRYYTWTYWVLKFAFHLYRRAKYQTPERERKKEEKKRQQKNRHVKRALTCEHVHMHAHTRTCAHAHKQVHHWTPNLSILQTKPNQAYHLVKFSLGCLLSWLQAFCWHM